MCYDIKTNLEAQLQRARRYGDLNAIRDIELRLIPYTDLPLFHASGFSHPRILIYTGDSPHVPVLSTWGLIPHWVRDIGQAKKLWNNTLNARGETIFSKPAFRGAAKNQRCLIFVDGFFEHHHKNGKTYPYYIHHRNRTPMALAGLWSEWADRETGELWHTFTIVTTEGNPLMSEIHNNPGLDGPRMPVILPEELEDRWIAPIKDEVDIKGLQELVRPYPDEVLEAFTVSRLRGKEYMGNVEGISEKVDYPELKQSSGHPAE